MKKTKPIFAFGSKSHGNALILLKEWRWLMSFYYLRDIKIKKTTMGQHIDMLGWEGCFDKGDTLMLDSGAYSALKQGIPIYIWDYMDFLRDHSSKFYPIVVLDVIGSPVFSEVNWRFMQHFLPDVEIMPVYHSGEPYSHFQRYVDQGAKYIGVAPYSSMSNDASIQNFLTHLWEQTDIASVKTHGFGYLNMTSLHKFKLTTADSTTWVIAAANGRLVLPPELGGQTITFSEHHSRMKSKTDLHYILKHGDKDLYLDYINQVIRYYDIHVWFDRVGKSTTNPKKLHKSRLMKPEDLKDTKFRSMFNARSLAYWFDTSYSDYKFNERAFTAVDLFDWEDEDHFFYRYDSDRIEPILEEAIRLGRRYTGYPDCISDFLNDKGWGDELTARERMQNQWDGL